MTSWKKGHMCRQHSTTTRPNRPSKAQTSPRASAVPAHHPVAQGGRCGPDILVFIPRGFGCLTAGGLPPYTVEQNCPAFPNYMLPKTPTLVLFLFLMFLPFFFFLVLSRVCVMFTSLNLKPVMSQEGGLTVTEQGLCLIFPASVKNGKKARKAKLTKHHPQKQVKG